MMDDTSQKIKNGWNVMISICVTTARGHKNQYTINILLLILLKNLIL